MAGSFLLVITLRGGEAVDNIPLLDRRQPGLQWRDAVLRVTIAFINSTCVYTMFLVWVLNLYFNIFL